MSPQSERARQRAPDPIALPTRWGIARSANHPSRHRYRKPPPPPHPAGRGVAPASSRLTDRIRRAGHRDRSSLTDPVAPDQIPRSKSSNHSAARGPRRTRPPYRKRIRENGVRRPPAPWETGKIRGQKKRVAGSPATTPARRCRPESRQQSSTAARALHRDRGL